MELFVYTSPTFLLLELLWWLLPPTSPSNMSITVNTSPSSPVFSGSSAFSIISSNTRIEFATCYSQISPRISRVFNLPAHFNHSFTFGRSRRRREREKREKERRRGEKKLDHLHFYRYQMNRKLNSFESLFNSSVYIY